METPVRASFFTMAASKDQKQYSAEQIMKLLSEKKSDFWVTEGQKRSLALFHEAAKRVPAYKDFLKQHGVDPKKVKTWEDFQTHVPVMSKKNYLRQYSLEQLCWDGSLKKPLVFTATSGSTGEPFYFPRDEALGQQSSVMHEMFLKSSGLNPKKSTLVIVCFGMGVWIGGLITYQAFKKISERGYPLTILTPGVNKKEIYEALKNIAGKFEQVILCGYPPFIKDIVDDAEGHGISLKKFDLRIVFAAEAFSEQFRQHIAKKTGIKNPYTQITNIYGTADLGTMAQETPLSIAIRKTALDEPRVFKNIFKEINRTPTLTQFNPLFTNFEAVDKNILCTGYNALPLIRYAIGDHGGVMSYEEMMQTLGDQKNNMVKIAQQQGFKKTITELPFVYVYERDDFSTKLYGAIVYPEHVKNAVQHASLEDFLTGKFTMTTQNDENQNQFLEINTEMRPGANLSENVKKTIQELVLNSLLEKNAEYRNNHTMMPDKVIPKIIFWEYEHPLHFKPGAKQKWIKK